MDYVTVRELREKSGEIWQRVEAGEEFVVTRNGKPFALLVHTEPRAVEETLRALRLTRMAGLVRQIQAEVDAARREASPAVMAAAEPLPSPYARRR